MNYDNMKRLLICSLFLAIAVACQTNVVAPQPEPQQTSVHSSNQSSPTPVENTGVETSIAPTLPPDEPTPTLMSEEQLEVQNVTNGIIEAAWWSSDKNTLYIRTSSGYFAYDPVTEKITGMEAAEVVAQTPVPEIASPLYRPPSVAPSGKLALYLNLDDAPPTVTPNPAIEGGERSFPRVNMELWLWEEGVPRSFGQLDHCGIGDHFWTAAEDKVVLVEFGLPMQSCGNMDTFPQAWLVDLSQNKITPLFHQPESRYVKVYGFSPDASQLLYGFPSDLTGDNLHLLDVATLTSRKLEAPVERAIQWIDDEKILVYYGENGMLFPPYEVGMLDIETLEFVRLIEGFDGLHIGNVSLSKDQKWLAFSTGDDYFLQRSLWVQPMNLD